MMAEYTLHFLGPTGTFTHQAAIEAAKTILPSGASVTLTPEPDVPTILDAVQRRGDWGIIAWETTWKGTSCRTSTRSSTLTMWSDSPESA